MSSEENEFERDRQERIQRNKQLLSSLGVQKAADKLAHDVKEEGAQKKERKRKRDFSAASAVPIRQSSRSTARATRMKLKVLAEDKDHEVNESDGSDDGSGSSDGDGNDDGDYGQGESSGGGSSELSESAGDENVVSDGVGIDEVHGWEEGTSAGPLDGNDDGQVSNRNDGATVKDRRRKSAEGSSKKAEVKKKARKKVVRGQIVSTKHWPHVGSSEVQIGYEVFQRAGGGLMTMVSVQEVASSLGISCENEDIEVMMEYAVKVTGCHPQCMTFEEFQKLFECLLETHE